MFVECKVNRESSQSGKTASNTTLKILQSTNLMKTKVKEWNHFCTWQLHWLIYFGVIAFDICSLFHQCFAYVMHHSASQNLYFVTWYTQICKLEKNNFMPKVLRRQIPGGVMVVVVVKNGYSLQCPSSGLSILLLLCPLPYLGLAYIGQFIRMDKWNIHIKIWTGTQH